MEYREVESALAKLHRIADEDMGAFKARLRVLRNMGIPDLPKVGKGARVEFSDDHVAELHLALTLGEFGLPPTRIVQVVERTTKRDEWQKRDFEGMWLTLSMRGDPDYRDESLVKGELLAVRIVDEDALLDRLKEQKLNRVATWHAVLDLELFGQDLADLSG